jgi:hypothetical protein
MANSATPHMPTAAPSMPTTPVCYQRGIGVSSIAAAGARSRLRKAGVILTMT